MFKTTETSTANLHSTLTAVGVGLEASVFRNVISPPNYLSRGGFTVGAMSFTAGLGQYTTTLG